MYQQLYRLLDVRSNSATRHLLQSTRQLVWFLRSHQERPFQPKLRRGRKVNELLIGSEPSMWSINLRFRSLRRSNLWNHIWVLKTYKTSHARFSQSSENESKLLLIQNLMRPVTNHSTEASNQNAIRRITTNHQVHDGWTRFETMLNTLLKTQPRKSSWTIWALQLMCLIHKACSIHRTRRTQMHRDSSTTICRFTCRMTKVRCLRNPLTQQSRSVMVSVPNEWMAKRVIRTRLHSSSYKTSLEWKTKGSGCLVCSKDKASVVTR